MAKVDILNIQRQKISEMELKEEIFQSADKPDLIHDLVRCQLAGRRGGNAATKERSFIRGGGRKPWKQKGTGRARSGSIRSPLWRGGGTIFGPHPRDYAFSIPKKVRRAALCSALAFKYRENKLLVLDQLDLNEVKTQKFQTILKDLGIQSALIVIDGPNENLEKSARNIPQVQVTRCEGLNIHDILRHEHVVFVQASLEKVERNLQA